MNKGAALWNEAKRLIPGGNQLLSKRSEMFLPDFWPAYYKKAKGAEIWDLNDTHYYDMSIMGIGTCVLGYANDEVNAAVKSAIDQGNMTTLNCPEEVDLAKKLIELHPWARMARFTRTGGEACAVAVRIGRAFSGKDKVAFCGYHGWHDWYLSSNLADEKNLNGQLLPGLAPAGVPAGLKGTAMPFTYGKIEELKGIVKKNENELGVIIMEVARHSEPDVDFLNGVKHIAQKIGAVLIFDEVSSGFRLNSGGMHLLCGIDPDICVLGKALGNGYPISAVIGKKDVMEAAQDSFISSTSWTERTGFVAALETIRVYRREQTEKHLIGMGAHLADGFKNIFKRCDLEAEIIGLSSVPIISIKDEKSLVIKTLFTQEMLKRGFLASNVIYLCSAHSKEMIDRFLSEAEEAFRGISEAIKTSTLENRLEGPVCHSGFHRLT